MKLLLLCLNNDVYVIGQYGYVADSTPHNVILQHMDPTAHIVVYML